MNDISSKNSVVDGTKEEYPKERISFQFSSRKSEPRPATEPKRDLLSSPILLPHKKQHAAEVFSTKQAVTSVTKKRWTREEDKALLEYVAKEKMDELEVKEASTAYWVSVAKHVNTGRSAKRCRDRYLNQLRPGIKKGDWSAEEVQLIRDMHDTFGSKWSSMARVLKYRTENDIKNKWYAMMRKEARDRATATKLVTLPIERETKK